jgi:nucleoside-diphosphate-sugar epimerase
MSKKKYLVTGGTGFIGNALVRDLLDQGHHVRVLDNNSRGKLFRLKDVQKDIEFVESDIRDSEKVIQSCRTMDGVFHLAYINGTEFFYQKPDLILDVAVKGMIHILDGCRIHKVPELILASSSEVYQYPPLIPTAEDVPLSIPDPFNPRFSYGGGKIMSELMAIHQGKKYCEKVFIFRPHNVYGPDMGEEHVIPQLVKKMYLLHKAKSEGVLEVPIQGNGQQTRSFIFIQDFIQGLNLAFQKSSSLDLFHIGTRDEVSIEQLVNMIGHCFKREVKVIPGKEQKGSVSRRCPDITKLENLGFSPSISLDQGLKKFTEWFLQYEKEKK